MPCVLSCLSCILTPALLFPLLGNAGACGVWGLTTSRLCTYCRNAARPNTACGEEISVAARLRACYTVRIVVDIQAIGSYARGCACRRSCAAMSGASCHPASSLLSSSLDEALPSEGRARRSHFSPLLSRSVFHVIRMAARGAACGLREAGGGGGWVEASGGRRAAVGVL